MPNINDVFTGDYLKATDLKGQTVNITISNVSLESFKDEGDKLIVHFHGTDKKLVCNKTNANLIAEVHGPETDAWVGKQITLHPARVEFQGKLVDAIRVQYPQTQQIAEPIDPPQSGSLANDLNDAVPF